MALAVGRESAACPPPPPLEAHVDLAKHIVSGTITKIKATPGQKDDEVGIGTATVEVVETLKGEPVKVLEFKVETSVPKNYGGCRAIQTHKAGDSGIWLIADGELMLSYGWLAMEDKPDIQRMVKMLDERKWSEPVNGLRAWAAPVTRDNKKPDVIFAVKNVTDKDIFVPSPYSMGYIKTTARGPDGKTYEHPKKPESPSGRVFCEKLAPGETIYLHPQYSCIRLSSDLELAPDKYSVVVRCANKVGTGEGRHQKAPVTAWTGELETPQFEMEVRKPDPPQKAGPVEVDREQ
jgi:hypothetical protein